MIIREYTDKKGFAHKVQLENAKQKPELGIHISVDIEPLLAAYNLSTQDMVDIQRKLWHNGIVVARDYFSPCYDKVVSAFSSKMPKAEAKIIGNALIRSVREMTTDAQRTNR